MTKPKLNPCPCCGAAVFEFIGEFEVCDVCEWEDDPLQRENPEDDLGANTLSLNEYRNKWQKSHAQQENSNENMGDDDMGKNIVILSGSPRKGGNTDMLVDAFIKGAESAAKTVTLFRVAKMKIGGCLDCGYCTAHKNECSQKDDMPQILAALQSADTVVFASPIYYAGVTAQLKAVIDRFFPFHKGGHTPWTKSALLLTCGNPNPDMANPTIAMFEAFRGVGVEDGGVVIASGIVERGGVAGSAVLGEAEKLGREI
jgi:putative NADPH-quinone reductase